MSLLSSGSGVRTSPGRPRTMIIAIDCWRDQPRTVLHRVISRILGVTQFMYWHIRSLIRSDLIDSVIIAAYDGRDSAEFLYQHSKPWRELWDLDSLIRVIQQDQIQCVYYAGSAWDSCVRLRPVGYLQLHQKISELNLDIEIRVQFRCVKDLQDRYFQPEQEPLWQAIPGMPGHYRLLPRP